MNFFCMFWFLSVLFTVSVFGMDIMVHHSYDMLEPDKCINFDYKRDLRENIDLTKCRPLDTVINLNPTRPHILRNIPSTVIVKRCGNCGCPHNMTCLPTSVETVSKAVQHILYGGHYECGYVNLEQHTSCKCGCMLSEESCNSFQNFFPRECICRCMDQVAKRKCIAENKTWNERDCSCSCTETNTFCSTGSVWIPSMCKCVKLKILDWQ